MTKTNYTLFIDESGDQDLEKFRTDERQFGSDPYLIFGAALVPNSALDRTRKQLEDLLTQFGSKELHCKDLVHLKRAYFARQVAGMQVLLFGVVSKKETVGDYRKEISGEKERQNFYNKCAMYLLERVGHFMSIYGYSSDQLSVVFEKKNHDYQRMRSLLRSINETPFDERAKYLARVDPLGITAVGKKDELLLSLADLTAFSIYQSVSETKSNFMLPEQRYLKELQAKFWKNPKTGQVANHGLKYIKGPFEMRLQDDALKLAMKFYRKDTN
jgi:hypothetical protein